MCASSHLTVPFTILFGSGLFVTPRVFSTVFVQTMECSTTGDTSATWLRTTTRLRLASVAVV